MRFAIYLTLLLATLPWVLTRPFFGLCVYYVVSLLQPKQFCWQPAFSDAMLVGVPLVVGAIAIGVKRLTLVPQPHRAGGRVQGLRHRLVRSPILEPSWLLGLCAALVIYVSVARLAVAYPLANNTVQFRNLCKVLIVAALLTGLASDLRRFRMLYLVVALSVAFWAIKGGLKVIVLGPHQVYGRSFDNNFFALTSVMTLPMVFYFAQSMKPGRWRLLLLISTALMGLAIIGSRSRAGFVAFVAVLSCMAWSSRYRLRAMTAVALLVGVAALLSMDEIKERVDSILAFQRDRSARSRFVTWEVALDLLAQSPVVGVGFGNFELAKDQYVGGLKAAHNIYLQTLAELGVVGHPLWLAIVFGSLASAYLFMRRSRRLPPEMRWAYYWSRGLMLGLMAYCIHGMFHNEAYLELMFVMAAMVASLKALTRRELYYRALRHEEGEGFETLPNHPSATRPRPRAWHAGQLAPV